MKGYTAAEWKFLRRHIQEQLRRQKPGAGASDFQVLLSLKRTNRLLGVKVWSRPEMLAIARHLEFGVGPGEGAKYGHIFWPQGRATSVEE